MATATVQELGPQFGAGTVEVTYDDLTRAVLAVVVRNRQAKTATLRIFDTDGREALKVDVSADRDQSITVPVGLFWPSDPDGDVFSFGVGYSSDTRASKAQVHRPA